MYFLAVINSFTLLFIVTTRGIRSLSVYSQTPFSGKTAFAARRLHQLLRASRYGEFVSGTRSIVSSPREASLTSCTSFRMFKYLLPWGSTSHHDPGAFARSLTHQDDTGDTEQEVACKPTPAPQDAPKKQKVKVGVKIRRNWTSTSYVSEIGRLDALNLQINVSPSVEKSTFLRTY